MNYYTFNKTIDNSDEFDVDWDSVRATFRRMYWKQIWCLTNTFGAKWIAIKSLWYMRRKP